MFAPIGGTIISTERVGPAVGPDLRSDLNLALKETFELTEPLIYISSDRRHDRDPEVAEILASRTSGQMERFVRRYGRGPEGLAAALFEEFLSARGETRFSVEPRPLVLNGRVDTDIGARVRRRGADPQRGPFLYLYIGTPMPPVRRAVEFGMRFGPLTEDGDACVRALSEPEVREMTDRALATHIDMTSVYGSDLDLERDDDAHLSLEPTWGRRAAFTVGYSSMDLPSDLAGRVLEVMASLWGPFLRSSLA